MTEARKKIKFLWNNYHIHAFLKIRAPSGFISFGVFTTDASCCKRSCELLPHYLTCLAWPEIAQKIFQVFVANYCHFHPPIANNQPTHHFFKVKLCTWYSTFDFCFKIILRIFFFFIDFMDGKYWSNKYFFPSIKRRSLRWFSIHYMTIHILSKHFCMYKDHLK